MKKKKLLFVLLIVAAYLFYLGAQFYFESKKEMHFIVTKIKEYPTSGVELFDVNKKHVFWNYSISKYDSIKIGDSIVKFKNKSIIYIYRKDRSTNYYLFKKKYSTW